MVRLHPKFYANVWWEGTSNSNFRCNEEIYRVRKATSNPGAENMDLENPKQESLNEVQGEIIRNIPSCDCRPRVKVTTYLGDDR